PNLDGFGLLHALRADADLQAIPVILLSARAGEEASIEGLQSGADDYLVKPFSARELLARVRTHLDLARMRRTYVSQLEEVNRQPEAANRELAPSTSPVPHDLRAPLRAINGFSTVIVEDHGEHLPAEARRLLGDIRASGKRMETIIEDLLRFSRLSRQPLA